MKHGTFTTIDGRNIRQINKTIAKKIFASGGKVYLLASNMRFDNTWQRPEEVQKDGQQYTGYDFDTIVNYYVCYNCDTIRGRYVNYFVEL